MDELILALGSILGFFVVLLTAKNVVHSLKNICAICGAVSLTWICLLILYYLGLFQNKVIIAVLLGSSVHGVYTLVEKKAERYLFFRLPFFLTVLLAGWTLVQENVFKALPLVVGLWMTFVVLYCLKDKKKVKAAIEKIVACCSNW